MSEKFEAARITQILREASKAVKLRSLALAEKQQRTGNKSAKVNKADTDALEVYLLANEAAAGWEHEGRNWTIKGKVIVNGKPTQAELGGPGYEHETNDEIEPKAQAVARTIIAMDAAKAALIEAKAALKEVMQSEHAKKYTSFSEDDGVERRWSLSTKETMTLTTIDGKE